MPITIIVDKTGTVKQYAIKDAVFYEDALYKKVGLKSPANFERIYEETQNNDATTTTIYLYSKKTGKSNNVNTFPFAFLPNATQNATLYGNCILLKLDTATSTILDFTIADFTKYNVPPIPPPIQPLPFNVVTPIPPSIPEPVPEPIVPSPPEPIQPLPFNVVTPIKKPRTPKTPKPPKAPKKNTSIIIDVPLTAPTVTEPEPAIIADELMEEEYV